MAIRGFRSLIADLQKRRRTSRRQSQRQAFQRQLFRQRAHEPLEPRQLLAFDTPDLNFGGQGFSGVYPPDTAGDVGVDHYVQMINSGGGATFTVYDKTSGSLVMGPTALDSFAPVGSACQTGAGDPVVLYDHLADRWVLTEFSGAGNALCVYISQTADITDNQFYPYQFNTPNFPDYPKYAVWPDGYYVSSNEAQPAVYVMDRENMLQGTRRPGPFSGLRCRIWRGSAFKR